MADEIQRAIGLYDGAVTQVPGGVTVRDPARLRGPATDRLVWQAVFGSGDAKEAARWLLWELGQVTAPGRRRSRASTRRVDGAT